MSIKIVKNVTTSQITIPDVGMSLAPDESFTIDARNYGEWAQSTDKNTYINSGALVVNDGTRDLIPTVGRAFLEDNIAFRLTFESVPERSNGMVSKNIQQAIEEAATLGIAAGNCLVLGFDGNASTGRWLEFLTNTASNNSPLVIPRTSTIRHLSVSVTTLSTVTFTVFKNGSAIASISLSNARFAYNNYNVSLSPGDQLSVQVTSGSCARPVLGIWF